MDLATAYYGSAILLHAGLLPLLLAAGRPNVIRGGFAVVVGANLAELVLIAFHWRESSPPLPVYQAVFLVDSLILWTLVVLATQLPAPLVRAKPRASALVLAAGLTALIVLAAVHPGTQVLAQLAGFVHDAPFMLVPALLALHVVPQWMRLPPGPLRSYTMLAAGGLAASALVQATLAVGAFVQGPVAPVHAFSVAGAWFAGVAAIRLAVHFKGQRGDAGVFLALLLVPVGVAALYLTGPHVLLRELVPQVWRPLLLTVAVVRFDLFRVAIPVRRVALPIALACLGTILFLLPLLVIDPASEAIPVANASLGALLLTGTMAVFARPLMGTLRWLARNPADHPEKLERYRLALEQLDWGDSQQVAGLATLRREWGITEEEHQVLAHIHANWLVVPTADLKPPPPGTLVGGRYEVVRPLGRGGFGEALLCRDTRNAGAGLWVVKRVVRPWEDDAGLRRDALRREAALGARLSSPHLPRIEGLLEEGRTLYLVREHVPGQSLEDLMAEPGRLNVAAAADVAEGVARALATLHDGGILHLDVKPENVVLRPDGRAVLIDLGSASHVSSRGTAVLTGPVAATAAWVAPEVALGDRPDSRTDIYAAGLVLARMLAATRPAGAAEARLGEALRACAARAAASDPTDRYPTASAFLDALQAARRPTPGRRAATGRRR